MSYFLKTWCDYSPIVTIVSLLMLLFFPEIQLVIAIAGPLMFASGVTMYYLQDKSRETRIFQRGYDAGLKAREKEDD